MRVYHLLKHMVRDHEVTILFYGSPAEQRAVQEDFGRTLCDFRVLPPPSGVNGRRKRLAQLYAVLRGRSASYSATYTQEMRKEIMRLVEDRKFDLVQVAFHGDLPALAGGPVRIFDAQNIDYDSVRRMMRAARSPIRRFFYSREFKALSLEEIEQFRRYDAVLVTSNRDRTLLDSTVPEIPKYVIPNGVDATYFQPGNGARDASALVFTGAFSYFPNVDGMEYFLEKIFPIVRQNIPNIKVYVVGSNPPKNLQNLSSENVIVTGYVEDVRPYVDRAAVYVVPLRMGGGTRLKVLEALAMKKPVVSTTIGCEGIEVSDGESLLIADEPEDFAAAVIRLLRDRTYGEQLAHRGYDLIRARYEWSVIGDRLREMHKAAATDHRIA
jgi:glycosyltransferase involved in cell wall biosynthesis